MDDKFLDGFFKWFGFLWVVCFLSGLAFTGVLIWAVISLVQHYT